MISTMCHGVRLALLIPILFLFSILDLETYACIFWPPLTVKNLKNCQIIDFDSSNHKLIKNWKTKVKKGNLEPLLKTCSVERQNKSKFCQKLGKKVCLEEEEKIFLVQHSKPVSLVWVAWTAKKKIKNLRKKSVLF